MKHYRITHRTKYTYSGLVQLGPHALRLRPSEGYDVRIESSTLTILPYAFLRWYRDVEGNSVAIADFKTLSDQLLIESVLLVEQYDQQPHNSLVEDYVVNFPFTYSFMEVAKQLGFASRFVSGYSYTTISSQDAGSTHAWAEVFLPGAGWKGFDPTRGDIPGENYIPVAVGRMPHLVPPISGSFHGNAF